MNETRMREIFAEELEKEGELGLARAIRARWDNTHVGVAAVHAMVRIVREVQESYMGMS